MATITTRQARFHSNPRSGPMCAGGAEEPRMREAASQTFKQGAPVYLSSGLLTVSANADGKAAGTLFGFALDDATGTTNTQLRVRKIQGGDIYVMNLEAGGDATATAQANLGVLVNFNVTSGNVVADITSPSTTKIYGRIIGFFGDDAIGDTGGRVLVEIPDQINIY